MGNPSKQDHCEHVEPMHAGLSKVQRRGRRHVAAVITTDELPKLGTEAVRARPCPDSGREHMGQLLGEQDV